MTDKQLTTPVLFLIFNRPDVTHKVFDEIRKVKPLKLFVAADGPRIDKPGEAEKCQQTKDIIKQVDWDCEVFTLFSDENLGCRKAVSSAISWFFDNVEEGIILEDDCVPDQSFFWFCQELLGYYRHDTRVMHIGGHNFQSGQKRGNGSYYFSRIAHVWGWATWRRAWNHFDTNLETFPKFLEQEQIKSIYEDQLIQDFWITNVQMVYNNNLSSWGFIWSYTVLSNNGLSIIPNVNLISNIGFGVEGTHTREYNKLANIRRKTIKEIIHPDFVLPDKVADHFSFYYCFNLKPPVRKHKLLRKILSLLINKERL